MTTADHTPDHASDHASAATTPDGAPAPRPSARLIGGLLAFVAAGGAVGMLLLGGAPTADASAPATAATTETATATAAEPGAQPGAAMQVAAESTAVGQGAQPPAAAASGQPDPAAMVAKLAERMKKKPDIDGLQMLGRAYLVMDRGTEAVAAYRQVLEILPKGDNAARSLAYSDLARAIGYVNGQKVTDEVESLLNEAVRLDNKNVLAHALLGKAALDRGQQQDARTHWELALAHLDPRHPLAEQLRSAVVAAGGTPPDVPLPTPPSLPTGE